MGKIIILGSGNAVPNQEQQNTHLLLHSSKRTVLIDCAGNPLVHIPQSGIEVNEITDIILSHFHPDHVAGLPNLLMGMWLSGRKTPLNIFGLEITIDKAQKMMDLYEWRKWPSFYPVNFFPISEEPDQTIINETDLQLIVSPVKHLIPTIGFRFEFNEGRQTAAYSCDTEPCQAVTTLAKDVDILIHEAGGDLPGHSTAEDAGKIADDAGVKSLLLIHYSDKNPETETLIDRANKYYGGRVKLARDFMVLQMGG